MDEIVYFIERRDEPHIKSMFFEKLSEYAFFLEWEERKRIYDLCIQEIENNDPQVIKSICVVLGNLNIYDSIGDLIWILENVPEAKGKALYSLRKISGMQISGNHISRWKKWWEAQVNLYNDIFLGQPNWDEMPIVELKRQIIQMSYLGWKDEISSFLISFLNYDNKQIRIETCKSLARLGQRSAVEPLLDTMQNDPENQVKIEAWRSLQIITEYNYSFNDSKWFELYE